MSIYFDWEYIWEKATIDEINKIGINTPDIYKRVLLHVVAQTCNNPKVILDMLRRGADFKAKDKDGKIPLHHAAESNSNPEIILALAGTDNCANINAPDKNKRTPLHYAAGDKLPSHGENNSNPEIILTLIKANANIEASDIVEMTPLHFATRHNTNHEITLALLENNANVEAKDKKSWRPLHLAAFHNTNPQVIELLLNEGRCDPKARTKDPGSSNAYEIMQCNPALKGDPICEELRKKCSK